MSLVLHAGALPATYDQLRALKMPEATETHVPIAHHKIVDMLKHSLTYFGHEVTDEAYGVTEDGNRFFGVLSLKSLYSDYEDTVGMRNSHDKKFPVGKAALDLVDVKVLDHIVCAGNVAWSFAEKGRL